MSLRLYLLFPGPEPGLRPSAHDYQLPCRGKILNREDLDPPIGILKRPEQERERSI